MPPPKGLHPRTSTGEGFGNPAVGNQAIKELIVRLQSFHRWAYFVAILIGVVPF